MSAQPSLESIRTQIAELPEDTSGLIDVTDQVTIETATVLYGGRYELLSLVGAGAYGSVYRARDTELEEIVAVKALRPEHLCQATILSRFRREVRLARRVSHPNVARTYDIGSHQGDRFLTMEYIDGQPLTQLCPVAAGATPQLPLRLVIEIMTQICAGLGALHAAGIIHRDMKTDNVLVGHDARVVITDFGIARTLKDSDGEQRSEFMTGTPAYMAPEQVRGHGEVDTRADLYALGVMLFQMLTGQFPFACGTAMETALARLYEPPLNPRKLRPQLPADLGDLVLRCLQIEPDARFQTADELAEALASQRPPGPDLESFLKSLQRVSPSRMSRPSLSLDQDSHATSDAPMQPSQSLPPELTLAANARQIWVAVLLFQQPDQDENAYLASGLTEELIDRLSDSPALRVASFELVRALPTGSRDPAAIGQKLKVQVVLDGRLQVIGQGMVATVRLIEVASGLQFAVRRFERADRNVLALAAEASKGIGSLLTVQLDSHQESLADDAVAVDLYIRARYCYQQLRHSRTIQSVSLFEQALARLPNEPTLLTGYALAITRLWFFCEEGAEQKALRAAERAIAIAPESGEAHLALATVHLNSSRMTEAAASLRQALTCSPRLAEAHELIGHILGECGPLELAIRYLRNAMLLDVGVPRVRIVLARAYCLSGRCSDAKTLLRCEGVDPAFAPILNLALARFAGWYRDEELARETLANPALQGPAFIDSRVRFEVVCGVRQVAPEEFLPQDFRSLHGSPRGQQFGHQILTEYHCLYDQPDEAMRELRLAVSMGLPDVIWMDLCPLLAPLRSLPEFQELRDQVEKRAAAVRRAFGIIAPMATGVPTI